ncbi:MAG: hypothetical protein WD294_16110 [Phycisphaeraceae bacterium]
MIRSITMLLLFALLTSSLVGCMRGPRNFENENDRLRRVNLELRDTVAELQQRTTSLERALEIERNRPDAANLPEGVQPPMVTGIQLGRFSGGIDTDGDGTDDAVRLYLNTLDARNRFLPAVGTAQVTVAAVPPGEEAVTVATAEFDADEFEQAYRSGIAGTHYTLVVPVTQSVPENVERVTVRVRFNDLLTGAQHETETTVRWSHNN